MKLKTYFPLIFFIIVIIAASFRLYQLSNAPPSLFSDEVDAGYQALVFNRCHSDYYGNLWPFHFHSFSDWRTPLYIYATALSQHLFGLNEFSTRFPAVFFGTLTIVAVYFLLKEISPTGSRIPLIGLIVASLSPWLFHFSRSAFEATGMLFCLTLGIAFFLRYLNKQHFLSLLLSIFLLSASAYFYSTAKLFLLLLGLSSLIFWSKEIFRLGLKKLLISGFLLVICLTPLTIDLVRQRAGFRFSYINIFSDPTVPSVIDRLRQTDDIAASGPQIGLKTSLMAKLLHNKPSEWTGKFITNYLSSFSADYLFISGDDNLRQGLRLWGYFYLLDLPLLLIGIYQFRHRRQRRYIFTLLLLSPIPFALTRDSNGPHATRLIIMLPFLISLQAFGFQAIVHSIKQNYRQIFTLGYLIIYLIQFGLFYHFYLIHYPQISARSWHDGMKETVLNLPVNSFSTIYLSDSYESFLPFYLFWSQYQPQPACAPVADSIIWDNHPGFVGQSINKHLFFGHLEWNQILSRQKNNFSQTAFVFPTSEIYRLTDALNSLNTPKPQYQLKIIKTISPKYETSQSFYITTIVPYESPSSSS